MYHATTGEGGDELAIKIYKTSILVFKDRVCFVSLDYPLVSTLLLTLHLGSLCHWRVPFPKGLCQAQPEKNGPFVGRKRNAQLVEVRSLS